MTRPCSERSRLLLAVGWLLDIIDGLLPVKGTLLVSGHSGLATQENDKQADPNVACSQT